MSDQLQMLLQTTLEDTRKSISSPVLVAGPMQLDWLDGMTEGQCGQPLYRANHSQLQAKVLDLKTQGTSGRMSDISLKSADLQRSLESNLRRRLTGSDLYEVTWKKWITPWGQCLFKPRVRALGTKGIEHGYLPTPSGTSNHGKNHAAGRLDEWGGSSNPFRGTNLGKVHCPAFELWVMGYPDQWAQLMPPAMQSSRKSRQK